MRKGEKCGFFLTLHGLFRLIVSLFFVLCFLGDVTIRKVPNEHGTWYFGRNGWCDGLDVEPLLFDITADVKLAVNEAGVATAAPVANTLQYYALAYPNPGMKSGGTQAGCGGTMTMSSYLVYY